jgi:signal transduction histidine kinase
MDHLQRLNRQMRTHLFLILLISNLVLLAVWAVGNFVFKLEPLAMLFAMSIVVLLIPLLIAARSVEYFVEPVKILWQAILHVSPGVNANSPAPNLEKVKIGRELVTSLSLEVYQLASTVSRQDEQPDDDISLKAKMIISSLPLPLIVMNNEQLVIFINDAARKYLNMTNETALNKNLYEIIDLSFPSDDTYDKWLTKARTSKATDTSSWEHVRLELPDKIGIK